MGGVYVLPLCLPGASCHRLPSVGNTNMHARLIGYSKLAVGVNGRLSFYVSPDKLALFLLVSQRWDRLQPLALVNWICRCKHACMCECLSLCASVK